MSLYSLTVMITVTISYIIVTYSPKLKQVKVITKVGHRSL